MKKAFFRLAEALKNNAGLLILSMVITGCFFSYIIPSAQGLYPDSGKKIEIKVSPSEENEGICRVELRNYATEAEIWEEIEKGERSSGWETYTGHDGSIRWIVNELTGPETLSFRSPKKGRLAFGCTGGKAMVEVTQADDTYKYELTEESWSASVAIPIHTDSTFIVVAINILSFIVGLSIVTAILRSIQYVITRSARRTVAEKETKRNWIPLIVLAIFIIWGFAGYHNNIKEYKTGFGDQGWYWAARWSVNPFETALINTVRFRGYISAWIPAICISLGSILGISGENIWILYLCILHTIMFGIAVPEIYEMLSGKKAKQYQVILLVLIYLFIWGSNVMAKSSDAGGLCFFFTGIWAFMKYRKGQSAWFAFLSGAAFAAAISYRMAYQYGLIGLAVYEACLFAGAILKKKKINWKRTIIAALAFLIGIVLISSPQAYSNFKSGVFSLFPYNPTSDNGISFAAESASSSMRGALVYGYPYGAVDSSLAAVTSRFGLSERAAGWSMSEILSMYSSQWMDTMVIIAKKLFFGLSIVGSLDYGAMITGYARQSYPFSHTSEFAVIPMVNYLLIGACIYTLFVLWKRITKREKIFWAILFITTVLPQTFTHVEWRYFIICYMMVYYFSMFTLTGQISEMIRTSNKETFVYKINKFLVFEGLFLLACEVLFWTFY